MSQTTLNLVAIGIFATVMSSLLGPLFGISPAIPAVTIFGVLSLATADIFAWRGQLGNLIVDWFEQFSEDYRDRILHHEAGHFLVAYVLEIPITGYTLNAWQAFRTGQPGRGGVSFDDQALNQELRTGELSGRSLDRYCTVWMAGAAAEKLVYGDVKGGDDDRDKLRLLWTQLRRPSDEGSLKLRWSTLRARTLLETHRAAYDALVNAMRENAPVDECCRLLADAIADQDEAIAA